MLTVEQSIAKGSECAACLPPDPWPSQET